MFNTHKFIDKSTERKAKIVQDKLSFLDGHPLFSIVEFNLYTNCTRACDFCPVSDPDFYTKKNQKMDFDLYKKIIDDLSDIDYQGKLLYSGFSEPLMHNKLADFILYTKFKLPLSRVEIVSNGDLVTEKKLEELFDSGLDTVSISMYDGFHQIEFFSKISCKLGLNKDQMVLRRRYFEDGNYGLTITNRGGLVDSNKYRSDKEDSLVALPLAETCYYPFYMIKVDYNGDVLLCSHDWSKKLILGNLGNEKLQDIWRGKKLDEIRRMLANKSRDMIPCVTCDVMGTLIGKDSFEAWLNMGNKNG
jgi:radical SAM protein with 4Fe4S-binding SPASM domain